MIRRSPATGSNPNLDPDVPPVRRHPVVRSLVLSAAGLALVAVVATVGFALAPRPADSVGPRDPHTAAAPSVTPTPQPEERIDAPVEEVADDVLGDFLAAAAAVTADPESDIAPVESVATGAMLEELQVERLELVTNEFSKVGTPTLVSVEVLEAGPSTATVSACIDSSDVRVVTASGDVVAGSEPATQRARNLYHLELRDGFWVVVSRSFPDDPKC